MSESERMAELVRQRDMLRSAIVRHRSRVLSAKSDADYRQADRLLWTTVGDLQRGAYDEILF